MTNFDERWAASFAASLMAEVEKLPLLIKNTAVVGALVEAALRERVRQIAGAVHVCRGAILPVDDSSADLQTIPELDTIFWSPIDSLPPLFMHGDFALVPSTAARGIIEIKKSIKSVPEFEVQLARQRDTLPSAHRPNVLGVVVHSVRDLGNQEPEPQWPWKRRDKGVLAPAFVNLFDETESGLVANHRGLLVLGHFLGFMAHRL